MIFLGYEYPYPIHSIVSLLLNLAAIGVFEIAGLDHWTGLLDWTTGLDSFPVGLMSEDETAHAQKRGSYTCSGQLASHFPVVSRSLVELSTMSSPIVISDDESPGESVREVEATRMGDGEDIAHESELETGDSSRTAKDHGRSPVVIEIPDSPVKLVVSPPYR